MKDLIQMIAQQSFQSMKPVQLGEAEVVSAPPNLQIKLLSNDKLIIPKELIVVAEYLCKHKRKVTITNTGKTSITSTSIVDLYPKSPPQSSHDFAKFELNSSTFTLTEGEIEFLDELKKGDKVLVASFQGGQKFFILDRIVTY